MWKRRREKGESERARRLKGKEKGRRGQTGEAVGEEKAEDANNKSSPESELTPEEGEEKERKAVSV